MKCLKNTSRRLPSFPQTWHSRCKSVKGQDIAAVVVGGAEHEGIPIGRRGETNVGGHKLVGMNIGVNFDAALLFPGLQMLPTPLKMRLEKRDMVVESMISSVRSTLDTRAVSCPRKARAYKWRTALRRWLRRYIR